jgi:hypothetical protein
MRAFAFRAVDGPVTFSKSFLQQLVLHAQLCEHLLQASVLVFKRLGLRDH